MKEPIRLLIVNAPETAGALMAQATPDFHITRVGVDSGRESGLTRLLSLRPDAVVVESMASGAESIQFIETLLGALKNQTQPPPKPKVFLVVNGPHSDELLARSYHLGVDYCFMPPLQPNTFVQRIKQFVRPHHEARTSPMPWTPGGDHDLARQVKKLVRNFGIPEHYKGFAYLVEAICLVFHDRTLLHRVTKELYPKVAEIYGTRAILVERAMRNAIEAGCMRGDINQYHALFGHTLDKEKAKPTNAHFIARMADEVRISFKSA